MNKLNKLSGQELSKQQMNQVTGGSFTCSCKSGGSFEVSGANTVDLINIINQFCKGNGDCVNNN